MRNVTSINAPVVDGSPSVQGTICTALKGVHIVP